MQKYLVPGSQNSDTNEGGVIRVQTRAVGIVGVVPLVEHEFGPEHVTAFAVHHKTGFV